MKELRREKLTSGAEARTHFQRLNGTSELVPFPFVENSRVRPQAARQSREPGSGRVVFPRGFPAQVVADDGGGETFVGYEAVGDGVS